MEHRFLYSVEREYPHAIETVWDAWTNAESLEKWYHPTVLSILPGSVISDAKAGGIWTVAVDVPMNDFVAYFFGKYTNVEPQKKIEHTMSYTQSAEEFAARDENAPFHKVTVDFESRGDKTWVKFSQYGEMPEEQIPATTDGMNSYFDSLEYFLDENA